MLSNTIGDINANVQLTSTLYDSSTKVHLTYLKKASGQYLSFQKDYVLRNAIYRQLNSSTKLYVYVRAFGDAIISNAYSATGTINRTYYHTVTQRDSTLQSYVWGTMIPMGTKFYLETPRFNRNISEFEHEESYMTKIYPRSFLTIHI